MLYRQFYALRDRPAPMHNKENRKMCVTNWANCLTGWLAMIMDTDKYTNVHTPVPLSQTITLRPLLSILCSNYGLNWKWNCPRLLLLLLLLFYSFCWSASSVVVAVAVAVVVGVACCFFASSPLAGSRYNGFSL